MGLKPDPMARENRIVKKMIRSTIESNNKEFSKKYRKLAQLTIEMKDGTIKKHDSISTNNSYWTELIKSSKVEELPKHELSKKVRNGIPHEL